jgi:hypothetical protein
VASEGDPSALFGILEDLGVPTEFFELSFNILAENGGDIEDSLLKSSQKLLPKQYSDLFDVFYKISRGNALQGS